MGQPRRIPHHELGTPEQIEIAANGAVIVSMLKKRAEEIRDRMQRIRRASEELLRQIRDSEERAKRLERDLKHYEARAQKTEGWVLRVQEQIQETYSESNWPSP